MFDYFYTSENEQYLFVQLPLTLIKNPIFKNLSDSSKILYSLLLNRTSLSIKNNWTDESGRVYIIYTVEEIMEDLNCHKQKASKIIKELKEIGLIQVIRQGLGRPNLIYVMNFSSAVYKKAAKNGVNTQKFENRTSGFSPIELQNVPKSNAIYIDSIDIDLSQSQGQGQTEKKPDQTGQDGTFMQPELEPDLLSQGQNQAKENPDQTGQDRTITQPELEPDLLNAKKESAPETDSPSDKHSETLSYTIIDDFSQYEKIIKDNISYNDFLQTRQADITKIDAIVAAMLDVICTEGSLVIIGNEKKSRNLVKSVYLKLNYWHIEHVLDQFLEQYHKITHVHAYIKTMLYNAYTEMDLHLDNRVRADNIILKNRRKQV